MGRTERKRNGKETRKGLLEDNQSCRPFTDLQPLKDHGRGFRNASRDICIVPSWLGKMSPPVGLCGEARMPLGKFAQAAARRLAARIGMPSRGLPGIDVLLWRVPS